MNIIKDFGWKRIFGCKVEWQYGIDLWTCGCGLAV